MYGISLGIDESKKIIDIANMLSEKTNMKVTRETVLILLKKRYEEDTEFRNNVEQCLGSDNIDTPIRYSFVYTSKEVKMFYMKTIANYDVPMYQFIHCLVKVAEQYPNTLITSLETILS